MPKRAYASSHPDLDWPKYCAEHKLVDPAANYKAGKELVHNDKHFYQLEAYAAWLTADEKRIMLRPNSSIEILTNDFGCFSTLHCAESFMRQMLVDNEADRFTDYVGFSICKRTIDPKPTEQLCSFEARWNYDGKGKLVDESPYDDVGNVRFFGRTKPAKFKVGDIAMVHAGDYMRPSLVVSLPPSAKWWKTHIKDNFGGDAYDDSYTVVTVGYGHTHPSSVEVFRILSSRQKLSNVLSGKSSRTMCMTAICLTVQFLLTGII